MYINKEKSAHQTRLCVFGIRKIKLLCNRILIVTVKRKVSFPRLKSVVFAGVKERWKTDLKPKASFSCYKLKYLIL